MRLPVFNCVFSGASLSFSVTVRITLHGTPAAITPPLLFPISKLNALEIQGFTLGVISI